jgi:hypothetical protein
MPLVRCLAKDCHEYVPGIHVLPAADPIELPPGWIWKERGDGWLAAFCPEHSKVEG